MDIHIYMVKIRHYSTLIDAAIQEITARLDPMQLGKPPDEMAPTPVEDQGDILSSIVRCLSDICSNTNFYRYRSLASSFVEELSK